MKSMMRLIALLGTVLILFACPALGEEDPFILPDDLLEIREETFADTDSLGRVIIPEGVRSIGERAFANSSVSLITLPKSLEEIADSAFDGCSSLHLNVWYNSYAHKWCALHSVPYTVLNMPETSEYGVFSLEPFADENGRDALLAAVSCPEACTLVTEVLKDSKEDEILMQCSTALEAGLDCEEVVVELPSELPKYYVLRAVLVDEDGQPLCDDYTTRKYTEAFHNIQNQTPDDFPAARVLDFGKAGYAVLDEDVKRTGAEASVSNGRYTLSAPGSLSVGDIIHFTVAGQSTVKKIGSLTHNANGSVTFTCDENVKLGDMYDAVYVDAYMTSPAAMRADEPIDDIFTVFDDTYGIEIEPAEISANLSVKIHSLFIYDEKWFGKDYCLAEIYVESAGKINFFVGGEIDTWKNNNAPRIPIYKNFVVIPGINLPAYLEVSVPVNIRAKAGGSAWFSFTNTSGFRFDAEDGWTNIKSKDSDAYCQLEGEFEISCGPEISLSETLFDKVVARIGGQIGARITGVLETPAYGGTTKPTGDSIHACLSCVKLDPSIFMEFRATLLYDITEKLSGTIMDAKIMSGETDLGDAHFSVINEKESIYGGHMKFDWGLCPNQKYRVNLSTYDMHGTEIKDLLVTVTGDKINSLQGLSPTHAYLYLGDYSADAVINDNTWNKAFTVEDKPLSVAIREKETTLQGIITSSKDSKPIPGATVVLTLPDGKTRTDTTDENGFYLFNKLSGGTYSITFSADKHETSTVSKLRFAAGSRQQLNHTLNYNYYLPLITAHLQGKGTVQALTEEGTCPEGVPEIYLTSVCDSWGYLDSVTIRHEHCAQSLVIGPNVTATSFTFYGADLGNGEYTFLLDMPNVGRGGGSDFVLFREEDGKLVKIDSIATSGIHFSGSFTSDTEFSGTLNPGNIPVQGTVKSYSSYENRTGRSIWNRGWDRIELEELENDSYVLRYTCQQCCLGIYDTFSQINGRFVMKDGVLTLDQLWYEVYNGTLTAGGLPS